MGIAVTLLALAQLSAPPMPAPLLPSLTAAHGGGIDDRAPHRHQASSRFFSITDGITTGVTFAVLASVQEAITPANKVTLAPNVSGMYRCASVTCYIAFSVRGGLQARSVARGNAYRFQFVGRTFDLYAIGD